MKHTEMQKGGIYFSNDRGYGWFIRFNRVNGNMVVVDGYGRKANNRDMEGEMGFFDAAYINRDWRSVTAIEKELREATYEEREWFEACEKAGGLVERPKTEIYAIY